MCKVVAVSHAAQLGNQTGRELLSSLNNEVLAEIFNGEICFLSVSKSNNKSLLYFAKALFGWLDGLDKHFVSDCLKLIDKSQADYLYVDGSNYGRLTKLVKLARPSCKVVTFFHNVESRFFLGAFKQQPSIKKLGVLIANYFAERMAVKYSDKLICLNLRDSELLNKTYGRNATNINPMCINTKEGALSYSQMKPLDPKYGLFVGGAFYANLEGVRWFAREVAPKIDGLFYIVGRGFDKYRDELEQFKNIKVVGEVDDLGEWYAGCSFVFSPIFDGSGMKTKTAEALQYGRPIIGTTESFAGYEDNISDAGVVCNTAEEFEKAIFKMLDDSFVWDAVKLRTIYNDNYSFSSAQKRLSVVFST